MKKTVFPIGKVFWFTGLSGAGKTTLARLILDALEKEGFLTFLLDGDEIRNTITKDLGYSEKDRTENVRRTAEIAKLMIAKGAIVLCAFMSPKEAMREMAKDIIGKENFYEIFVDASIETCISRDTKGLYQKFNKGEITNVSGLDAPFDEPLTPFLTINTNNHSVEESVNIILRQILNKLA